MSGKEYTCVKSLDDQTTSPGAGSCMSVNKMTPDPETGDRLFAHGAHSP